MRLSEIRGERVFEVVADLVGPIASIARDEDAASLFKPDKAPEGMDAVQYFLMRVEKGLPSLLRTHMDDVIAIMCAIKGQTREEYLEGVTLESLMADVIELMTDKDVTSFFG